MNNSTSLNLDNISIILVEPQNPGNIGSVARACKNLGIQNIVLVNPCDYLVEEAFCLGKNAKDVIYNMKVVDSLEKCLKDHHILIGTTRRKRDKQPPFYSPPDIIKQISPQSRKHTIGFVFGRENHGLSNEELALCNFYSSIPSHQINPVFNLSQAVLLYAYECFNASGENKDSYKWSLATKNEEQILFKNLENMLESLSFDARKGIKNFTNLFKRVLGRSQLEKRDVRLFHKLCDLIKFTLNN